MKSSPNLNPSGKDPQKWIPVDFLQNNPEPSLDIAQENSGKQPVPLFAKLVQTNEKSSSVTRVIKEAQNIVTSDWQPGDITSAIPTVSEHKPGWQPSLKFATTTAPHDISRELISDCPKGSRRDHLNRPKDCKRYSGTGISGWLEQRHG